MNTKEKKRKKRAARLKKKKHSKSLRDAYLKKYPNVFVKQMYASIDFVEEIWDICRRMDLRDFPEDLEVRFRDHKNMPSRRFISKYSLDKDENEESHRDDPFGFRAVAEEDYCKYTPYIKLEDQILLSIYRSLRESGSWDKFTPIHNIVVRSFRGDFVVIVNGFHQHHSAFGKGYYTDIPTYIEIPGENGKSEKFQVAISMHALQRVFERTFSHSLGDDELKQAKYPLCLYQFGLYSESRIVPLANGEEWGAAIYINYRRGPDHPDSIAHKVAYEILHRMERFKILCGYCPIGFCKDEFVHFKTLLSPGMRGTPEDKLLRKMEDRKERDKFESLVSNGEFTDEHIELYKFFQNSGLHIVEYLEEEEV